MTNPDPTNPNAPNFDKPAYALRQTLRKQSLSQRIRTSQARLATVKPAKITLPQMPQELRDE